MSNSPSLDDLLAAERREHADAIQAMKDKVLAADVKATILEERLAAAVEARAHAESVATKLLTQFGLVSQVFDEARRMALELTPPVKTEVPANQMESTQ